MRSGKVIGFLWTLSIGSKSYASLQLYSLAACCYESCCRFDRIDAQDYPRASTGRQTLGRQSESD